VWRLDLKTLSFNAVLAPERGLIVKPVNFGSTGAMLKWSAANRLFLLNRNFERGEELLFPTFPDKCDAEGNTLYCFVPRTPLPQNIPLPDGYYQNKFRAVDSLVRTVITSSSTFAFDVPDSPWASTADAPVDAKNPAYADGSIYFINRYDGYVYGLKL
ncbi:MAG: hypothetical protein V1656_02805, partial [Candidatus Jorgensenbacteria bacterium]